MVSDVLFDALDQIEAYQRDFPQVYDGLRTEIDPVKHAMRRLQEMLDTAPTGTTHGQPWVERESG